MFSRLNQQRNTIKNNQPPAAPLKRTVQSTSRSRSKSRSYSAMQKQKTNSSDLYNYQISWICDHLYQGCFYKNKKHGQGLMILSNGVVVVGNWKDGKLNGYSLFLSPLGGRIHANFKLGLLQGWTIVQFGNNFEIIKFKNDLCQPIRRRYDEPQQLWTQASFSRDGKLTKIIKIQKTKYFKLPSFITDQSLIDFYDKAIMKNEADLNLKRLSKVKINDRFQYYGYTNEDTIPNGLGVIYSNKEIYAGNFKAGSLDEYGMILFQNGLIYKGQIYGGKIWGDGVIYDINLDQTKTVKVCQEGVELVVMREQGFKLQIIPFKIGKIPSMPDDKGFSSAIYPIFQQITKYYFRANSSNIDETIQSSSESQKQSQKSSLRQWCVPQQFKAQNIVSIVSPNRFQADKKQQIKQPSNLFYLNDLSSNSKKPSNSDSLTYSMEQQNKKLPETAYKIPSFAPTYAQITQITQTNSKYPEYPYLMQFQLNKNIITPYKFSKIGKIVANSLKIAERYK